MKSPLKFKPLNTPGESLEKQFNDTSLDEIFIPSVIAFLTTFFAAYEWYRWYFDVSLHPLFMTFIALTVIVWASVKFVRGLKKIKLIKQGIASEKAVGQYLERLRANGAEVFHDIQGENFNLDHVVIDKSGVYVVETKALSKPLSGKTELIYDGSEILRYGKPLPRNPVAQVSAASGWLKELIYESTGRQVAVKGIVAFPGWYISSKHNTPKNTVWVLNPKAIPAFIAKQGEKLTSEDVQLLKFHLGKYIRSM